MDYKVYLDYTMELLSKIKIPSYIIDTPFLWDDRYDGELRKTILSDAFLINHKETFQNFINCSGKNNTILLIHDSFACDYIYIKLPDSKKAFFRPLHIRKWRGRGRLLIKLRYSHSWLCRFLFFGTLLLSAFLKHFF